MTRLLLVLACVSVLAGCANRANGGLEFNLLRLKLGGIRSVNVGQPDPCGFWQEDPCGCEERMVKYQSTPVTTP